MSMHVTGAAYGAEVEDRDISDLATVQNTAAEVRAWELVQALMSALAGEPHWRRDAQELLRQICAGDWGRDEPRR
jgi:hypothetical protein